jgi:hypothetical protein
VSKEQNNFKVDFVVAGVQKGGTTSSQHYLNQHPKIYMPWQEIHFYDFNFKKGPTWYEDKFDVPEDFVGLVGDKSPSYCCFPSALGRIKNLFSDTKLIVFLREPAARMYSQWNMQIWKKTIRVDMTFSEYIKKKEKYVNCLLNPFNRGRYIKQLKNIVNIFGRDNLHIVVSERCKANILGEYNKIYNFLGVHSLTTDEIHHKNKLIGKYKEPMYEKDRDYLREFYKPYNEELFEFLGYEIEEWRCE